MMAKLHFMTKSVSAVFLTLMLLAFTPVKAQTACAIWCAGNATLYFTYTSSTIKSGGTYDGQTITDFWKSSSVFASDNQPYWNAVVRSTLKKVVFDQSFKNVAPESTKQWFYRCKNLESVEGLRNLNTSSVTKMSEMFRECEMITDLDLSAFDTHNVKEMESMFNGCKKLQSLDVSRFGSEKLTTTKNMFAGCESLKELTLVTPLNNSFKTASVIDMEGMFYGCETLTKLDVTNLNTTKVKTMSNMFYGCSSLKILDLRGFNTGSIVNLSNMFNGCADLTTIKCNDTWSATNSTYMFLGCGKLKGAISYDPNKTDVRYANPNTGYFYSAADYDIKINGIQVDSRNCGDLTVIEGVTLKNSAGKAVYDSDAKRLELTDVNIKHDLETGIESTVAGLEIRCNGLTLVECPTAIALHKYTTITGNRSVNPRLTLNASEIGLKVYDGTTTITGGLRCTFVGGTIGMSGDYSDGIFHGYLEISDGNTYLRSTSKTWTSMAYFKEVTLSDGLKITSPEGGYVQTTGNHEAVNASGARVRDVIIQNVNAPVYDIKICGEQVSRVNYTDLTKISGVTVESGGYARYNPNTNTLMLKNADIRGSGNYLVDCFSQGLTINVEGDNYIWQTSEEGQTALGIRKSTTITGDGTLKCGGGYNGPGIYLADTLTVDGPTVEARGKEYGIKGYYVNTWYGYHYYGYLAVKAGYGKVIANGATSCIADVYSLFLDNNVKILSPEGAEHTYHDIVYKGGLETVKGEDVVIGTEEVKYGLTIAEIPVTSLNYKNLAALVANTSEESRQAYNKGTMDIKFDPDSKQLTLQNVVINVHGYGEFGLYNYIDDLQIKLIGKNSIKSDQWTGLCSISSGLTIFGSGATFFAQGVRGMDLGTSESNYLRVENCELAVEGSVNGIEGSTKTERGTGKILVYYTTIFANGANTVIKVKGADKCFANIKAMSLGDGLKITQPEGAAFTDHTVSVGGEPVKGVYVVIKKATGVPGDVNGDGKVDITDIVAVINTIAGDTKYKATADVNGDKSINITDVVTIISIIANK